MAYGSLYTLVIKFDAHGSILFSSVHFCDLTHLLPSASPNLASINGSVSRLWGCGCGNSKWAFLWLRTENLPTRDQHHRRWGNLARRRRPHRHCARAFVAQERNRSPSVGEVYMTRARGVDSGRLGRREVLHPGTDRSRDFDPIRHAAQTARYTSTINRKWPI